MALFSLSAKVNKILITRPLCSVYT